MKETFDVIISINVHEKPEYLKNQLDNIKKHMKVNYKIILSCNDFMYQNVDKVVDNNVAINPEIINKKTFHGSLTKGICSNMNFSLNNFYFKYFIVMSSREFFYADLNQPEDIEKTASKVPESQETIHSDFMKHRHPLSEGIHLNNYSIQGWHWNSFKNTKLFKYIEKNNLYFAFSAHEGLSFNYNSCQYIALFLENNPEIKEDLFNFNSCMEEFALQSICCNYSKFYYIGNGYKTNDINNVRKDRFTHKKVR